MKNLTTFLFLLSTTLTSLAQVITTDPTFPKADQPVTITFNAAEGSGGLANFSGDIYAHTGVLTDRSSTPGDWKYVIAGWSENTAKAKLNPLGNNLWSLEISPSIREFYGVPVSETIEKMAFVFRNADGSKEGKTAQGGDIFVEVYELGLNISLLKPSQGFLLLDANEGITVEAAATMADSIQLWEGNELVHSVTGNQLIYEHTAASSGIHKVLIIAYANEETVETGFSYMIQGSMETEAVPAGMIKGINYVDDSTAVLVLYAPEKDFVFAIGDFNDWEIDTDYLMKATPDGSYYWIQLNRLQPGKEYIFQYLIDGEIRIADPYTHKTSDPWNDQYIEQSVYPDLIQYPAGKTSQVASVLQTNQAAYQWVNTSFEAPEKRKLVIYELLIRDFLNDHSFVGLIDTLDYLSRLGINAIELLPVNEFEGNSSWGYNTSFHFAVDKYYGPADALKALVDSAHQRGMAVILDMVLNHAYGQCPLARMYWNAQENRPAANNPWFNEVSPNPVFAWGSDFNHESVQTQEYVDSVASYWMQEFQVDGFRFDFTKGFTNTPGDGGAYDGARIAILKRMADQIWSKNPKAYVILEHFAVNTEEKELADHGLMIWGNMNQTYRIAAKGFIGGGASDLWWTLAQNRDWNEPNLVSYMESHDEERLAYLCLNEGNAQNIQHSVKELPVALQRMELCAHFHIPLPGPKMIWMFGELGYDYSIDFNGRVGEKPIRWDYLNNPRRLRLNQIYGGLAHLKQDYPAFASDDFEFSLVDSVKIFNFNHPDMNVSILGNFATWPKWGQTHFQHGGWWYEYWTGDSIYVENTEFWIQFQPSEYRLYTDVKLDQPDIVSGIEQISQTHKELKLYPNPAQHRVRVDIPYGTTPKELKLLDLNGRVVFTSELIHGNRTSYDLGLEEYPEGIYFIRLISQSDIWQGKLILAEK